MLAIRGTGNRHRRRNGTRSSATRDCLYVGQGAVDVEFHAADEDTRFYLFSTPSHASFPTTVARFDDVDVLKLGDQSTANVREIRKFVHADGIRSSQLVLGVTSLAPGSVWNTMPPHTHDRRTECYLYFDLPGGPPRRSTCAASRRTPGTSVVRNEEAVHLAVVVRPQWSGHALVHVRLGHGRREPGVRRHGSRRRDGAAMSFSLAGKTAVVTGARTGIGRAIARGLADAGASVDPRRSW